MKSTKFTLNKRDFLRGALIAAVVPALVIIQQSVAEGSLVFNWNAIITSAIGGFVAYILKNYFTNDVKVAENIIVEAKQKEIEDSKTLKDQPLSK